MAIDKQNFVLKQSKTLTLITKINKNTMSEYYYFKIMVALPGPEELTSPSNFNVL